MSDCPMLPPEIDRRSVMRRAETLLEMIDEDPEMVRSVDHRLALRLLRTGVKDLDAMTAWLGHMDWRAAETRWQWRDERGLAQQPAKPRPQIAAWARAMANASALREMK